MGKLRQMRELTGKTQQQVATHLNITRARYSQIEQNQDRVTIEQAKKICEFFGADPKVIFFT